MDASPDASKDLLRGFFESTEPRADRRAAGKALRDRVPRAAHADYAAATNRADPVDILIAQNATRLPALVPVRMGRMVASPFAFLRGSAAVMAADLAPLPVSGLNVMACGDMHVANFGLFASAERNLVFAINDFDEVHPGPWEWDVKRLAASATVAATFLGGSRSEAEAAAFAAVEGYVDWIDTYSQMGVLETWYSQIDEHDILSGATGSLRKAVKKLLKKARARGHMTTLDRLTRRVDGSPRLIEDYPIIVRETQLPDGTPVDQALNAMLRAYLESLSSDRRKLLARYQVVDVVHKVVGVGSVGLGCWVLFLRGEDDGDPLFLQVKVARPSVLKPHVKQHFNFDNEGHRVVSGQRLIQGSPDIFLGWGIGQGAAREHYYVRQLADMKGGVKFAEGGKKEDGHFDAYARLCGRALALAHAKSGDASMISGYCGRSDALPEAMARFAMAYATQTMADHELLEKAVKAGRVPSVLGL